MPSPRWKPAVDAARQALVRVATSNAGARALMERSGRELVRAAETGRAVAEARAAGIDGTYGGSYFGEGRDASGDRAGRSGYARYDRVASNADIAGWLLWRNLRARRSLDVGCATGYLVEVLRERGIDAEGCDVSPFAIEHAAPGARGHVRVANLFAGLPWDDGAFDLVIDRARQAGVIRDDVSGADVTQLVSPVCTNPAIDPAQSERLMAMILDGLRYPAEVPARP